MKSVKKIDIHAHVTPLEEKEKSNMIDEASLLSLYDELGIEQGVILPFLSLRANVGVNTPANANALAKRHPDHFFWFTSVDLSKVSDHGELFHFLQMEKEKGARGVGEITTKLYFDDERVDALFSCCAELNLPMLFHIAPNFDAKYGVVDEAGLFRLEKMLSRHPKAKFIGHAKPFWREIASDVTSRGEVEEGRLAKLLRQYDNLYCDLSAASGANAMMRDPEYAAHFLTEFSERILYGCDICQASNSHYRPFAEFLDGLYQSGAIAPVDYEAVCRNNALRLLGEARI